MGRVILRLPRLGETMEQARVTDWLVAPGAGFKRGDILLEVETDKTVVEVPAMTDGVLIAQLVSPGDMVDLDAPIAEIDAEGAGDVPTAKAAAAPIAPQQRESVPASPPATGEVGAPVAASPAARAAARRTGADLTLIAGTGRRGRITAEDVAGQGPDADRQKGAPVALHHIGGAGVPIVLLHGLYDDHRGWRDLPRRLAAAGHAVVSVDLPGHGDSVDGPASLDAAARAVADALTTELPQCEMRLIGHSLGAAVATKVAVLLAGRIDRLILSAPLGLGTHIDMDFLQGMLTAGTTDALSRALSRLDAGPLSQAILAQELARLQRLRPLHRAWAEALAQGGFQQIDITGDLARTTCDVRVIFGTGDRILDWQDVANLPARAAVHLVRGAGHLPHHAVPDLVVTLATTTLGEGRAGTVTRSAP